jgi:hypothetical protein
MERQTFAEWYTYHIQGIHPINEDYELLNQKES